MGFTRSKERRLAGRVEALEAENVALAARLSNIEAGLRVAGAALAATGNRDAEQNSY